MMGELGERRLAGARRAGRLTRFLPTRWHPARWHPARWRPARCFLVGTLVALLPAAIAAPAKAADLIQWSDSFVGYRFGTNYREPGNPEHVTKSIVQFQHADGWTYGSNFFNLDVLLSNHDNEPYRKGGRGAREYYAVFRTTLSAAKIGGTPIAIGPINDVGLTIGGDLSYKDDAFNARVRKFVIGPTVNFDVPGYAFLSFLFRTEHNHNGIVGKGVGFDPHWGISGAWGLNFDLGLPAVQKGFFNIVGRRGQDGFSNPTSVEFLLETALLFDAGSLGGIDKTFYLGPGYQYWSHKFGSNNDFAGPGTKASVLQFVAEAHF